MSRHRRDRFFIQRAIKHPGSLRRHMREHHRGAFTKKGTIKVKALIREAKHGENKRIRAKARLALILRKLRKKRGRRRR